MPGIWTSLIVVVSRGSSSGLGVASWFLQPGSRVSPVADKPKPAIPCRNWRRLSWLLAVMVEMDCFMGFSFLYSYYFQLRLKFIEEAPIRTPGDDLVRTALDKTSFMEAQGIETHRISKIGRA